jgi:hypothetical protein
MLQLSILIGVVFVLLLGTARGDDEPEVPIACSLSLEDRADRNAQIVRLFSQRSETRELSDGYAFRFPADSAAPLLEFVEGERRCCPFLTFELVFEPQAGPVWLRVRGTAEIKTFIGNLMAGEDADPGIVP